MLFALLLASCAIPTPDIYYTTTPNPTLTAAAAAKAASRRGVTLPALPVPVTAATATEDPEHIAFLTRAAETVQTATAQAMQGTVPPSPNPSLTVPPPTPTASPTLPPTPQMTSTPRPTGRLPFMGDWGLLPTRNGLWAMRPDGSNLILLTNDPIYHITVSPTGRMAAYVTHPNPDNYAYENPFGYKLKLITLPEARVFDIVTLDMQGVTPDSPYGDLDRAFQAISVFERGGMDWSPGGLRLAFSSAHEGPAADLYIYTPSVGLLQRISTGEFPNGPAHTYNLQFSPDGSRIFSSRAYHFGMGNGYWMAGSWVTRLDGTSVQVAGDQYTGERLIDWPRNDTLLLSSYLDDCGDQNLRMVNAISGEEQALWPNCFDAYLYDRRRGEILISVMEDMAAFQKDRGSEPGLFLYTTWQSQGRKLADKGFESLYRGDIYAGWYAFTSGEGLFSILRDGHINPLFTGAPYDGSTGLRMRPFYHSPGDATWLWSGDGFYAAQPGQEPHMIALFAPESFSQAPNRNDLYYFTVMENGQLNLYALRRGEWAPLQIENQVFPDDVIWINR